MQIATHFTLLALLSAAAVSALAQECTGAPPAQLRYESLFDGSGDNPEPPVNITYNNRLIPEGSDSFLEGMIPLIWARNSVVARGTVTRTGSGGSLWARVGVAGLPACEKVSDKFERNRAEAQFPNSGRVPWDDGNSYWIGFSVNPTVMTGDVWTLFQLHAPAAKPEVKGAGANSITIAPEDYGGKPVYVLKVIDGWTPAEGRASAGTKPVLLGQMKLNTWTDFVLNFTLSTKGDGYVRLWVNGQKVYEKTGMTNTPYYGFGGVQVPDPYRFSIVPRVGIYGPDCKTQGGVAFREAYFDNFRYAVGCDGYKLVDPSNGRGSPPPLER